MCLLGYLLQEVAFSLLFMFSRSHRPDLKRVAKLAAWSKTQFVTRLEIWIQDPFPSNNRAEPLDGSVGSIKISL
jgi:hypothetical protein